MKFPWLFLAASTNLFLAGCAALIALVSSGVSFFFLLFFVVFVAIVLYLSRYSKQNYKKLSNRVQFTYKIPQNIVLVRENIVCAEQNIVQTARKVVRARFLSLRVCFFIVKL